MNSSAVLTLLLWYLIGVYSSGSPAQNLQPPASASSGAVTANGLYNALVEKCPNITKFTMTPQTLNGQVLQACTNWTLSKTPTSNDGNLHAECSIYYTSLSKYCQAVGSMAARIQEPDSKIIAGYTSLEAVCSNATVFNYSIENKTEIELMIPINNCMDVCSDMGLPKTVCRLSFHYRYLVSAFEKTQPKRPTSITGSEKKPEAPNPQIHINKANSKSSTLAPSAPLQKNLKETEGRNPNSSNVPNHPIENAEEGAIPAPPSDMKPAVPVSAKSAEPKPQDMAQKPSSTTEQKKLEAIVDEDDGADADEDEQNDNDNIDTKDFSNNDSTGPPSNSVGKNSPMLNSLSDTPVSGAVKEQSSKKPSQTNESPVPVNSDTELEGDSYFFSYFMVLCAMFVAGYVCYHNKQKILALILEGRRGRRQYRSRRPNSANYHKLDSNLEEAITSSCSKNSSNVIY